MYIFLRFTVISTVPTNHRSLNSSRDISNESIAEKPNFIIKLQDNVHYTLRKYSHNIFRSIFNGENRIERSRILQVWIERIFLKSPNIRHLYLFLFYR